MICAQPRVNTLQTATVCGKIGEFLQGADHDGNPLLYTATVGLPSFRTQATLRPGVPFEVRAQGQVSTQKTELAIRRLLTRKKIPRPWSFEVILTNSRPSAKGLGASSADLAAALLATAEHLGLELIEAELFAIMCEVERSDFLFWPDKLICANPSTGAFSVHGTIPSLRLIAWDSQPQDHIATEDVAHLDSLRRAHASEYLQLANACNTGQAEAILHAATRSGELNQIFLPKPCFRWALNIAHQNKTGLLVAHTGTFMAFALGQKHADPDRLAHLEKELRNAGFNPLNLLSGTGLG